MIKIRNLIGIASVFCVLAVLAMPASALPQDADSEDRVTMISGHLDKLESEGYDVSAMRTALENEDMETLRELMKEFMDGHNIESGSSENGEGRGHVRNGNGILDKLESEGYDVSEMRTALENGDMGTFHTLMKNFMEEHSDELDLPEKGDGQGHGMKGGDADGHFDELNLPEKGDGRGTSTQ